MSPPALLRRIFVEVSPPTVHRRYLLAHRNPRGAGWPLSQVSTSESPLCLLPTSDYDGRTRQTGQEMTQVAQSHQTCRASWAVSWYLFVFPVTAAWVGFDAVLRAPPPSNWATRRLCGLRAAHPPPFHRRKILRGTEARQIQFPQVSRAKPFCVRRTTFSGAKRPALSYQIGQTTCPPHPAACRQWCRHVWVNPCCVSEDVLSVETIVLTPLLVPVCRGTGSSKITRLANDHPPRYCCSRCVPVNPPRSFSED